MPKITAAAKRRAEIVAYAHQLVGIHEVPTGSNRGPVQQHGVGVDVIQSSTRAYGAAWCVSTVQWTWLHVLGSVWADKTANAYYLASFAHSHGSVIPHPLVGCAVVYHLGAGHAGTVVALKPGGLFQAVEGNEADRVELVTRDPKHLGCTFVLRPELRG